VATYDRASNSFITADGKRFGSIGEAQNYENSQSATGGQSILTGTQDSTGRYNQGTKTKRDVQLVEDASGSYTYDVATGRYYDNRGGNPITDQGRITQLEQRRGVVTPPAVTTPGAATPGTNVLPSQNRTRPVTTAPNTGMRQVQTPTPAGRQATGMSPTGLYGEHNVPNPGAEAFHEGTAPAGTAPGATSGLGGLLGAYGMQLPDFNPNFDKYLKPAEDVFRSELERLSQADPFGNQAFLQKATDRGVAQARAVAAGARGGAGAVGGAFRQAQGVQSQMATQGAQEMTQLKAQDARQVQGLRLQAAQGLGNLAAQGAGLAVEAEKGKVGAFTAGIDAILRSEQLSQQDRQFYETLNLQWSSLDEQAQKRITDAAVAYSTIDQQRYQTDVNYRAQTDAAIVQRYGIDKNFEANMKQIASSGKLTFKDVFLGTLAAGGASVAAIAGKPG
jgi:hypothetical protein